MLVTFFFYLFSAVLIGSAAAVITCRNLMMLDVDFVALREGFQRYLPVGITVGVILFTELLSVLFDWQFSPATPVLRLGAASSQVENTRAIGQVLYTDYILLFQLSGLILLVAMIGAIVLTHRDRHTSRHQNITRQQERRVIDTLEVVELRSGAGIAELGIYRPRPGRGLVPAITNDAAVTAPAQVPGEH